MTSNHSYETAKPLKYCSSLLASEKAILLRYIFFTEAPPVSCKSDIFHVADDPIISAPFAVSGFLIQVNYSFGLLMTHTTDLSF